MDRSDQYVTLGCAVICLVLCLAGGAWFLFLWFKGEAAGGHGGEIWAGMLGFYFVAPFAALMGIVSLGLFIYHVTKRRKNRGAEDEE